MIYAGIDISSDKHEVAIIDENGQLLLKNTRITNNESGIARLTALIDAAKKQAKDSLVQIGMESTGVYSVAILNRLYDIYQNVVLINPILTKSYVHAYKVHYAKTDKADAISIAEFLRQGKGIRTYTPISYHKKQLKEISRSIMKINKQLNKDINSLKGMIQEFFPEFFAFKDNKDLGYFELDFLTNYPTKEKMLDQTSKKMYKEMSKIKNSSATEEKIKIIQEYAKKSIGADLLADGTVVKTLAKGIRVLMENKSELEKHEDELVKEDEESNILTSVPGVGKATAASFASEIGDANNFDNVNQVIAYTGLNPYVYQSGNYKAEETSISKKGSKYLRKALAIAVMGMHAQNTNSVIRDYVLKKIAEGKSYKCAIDHGARKLERILFHIMKSGESWDEDKARKLLNK